MPVGLGSMGYLQEMSHQSNQHASSSHIKTRGKSQNSPAFKQHANYILQEEIKKVYSVQAISLDTLSAILSPVSGWLKFRVSRGS